MNFSMEKFGHQFLIFMEAALPKLIGAVLVLAIGWWLSNAIVKLMYRGMMRSKTDTGIITFICSLIRALFKIIVCITAMAQLGMNVSSIIAALGAAGLAIGLALKDSMSNIASGAQIIFTKPFRVGDYLAFDHAEGKVERIEIMFTTLRTFDNKEVVVPNSKVTTSVITNYSAMETRRLDLNYAIGYDEDIASVKSLLGDLVQSNAMIHKDPSPLIVVGEHGENHLTIGVKVWCKTEDYWTVYFDMQEKVKLAFDEAGILIPYNRLNVQIKPTV